MVAIGSAYPGAFYPGQVYPGQTGSIHYTGANYPVPTLGTMVNRVRDYVRDWPQLDALTAAVTDTTTKSLTVADATAYTSNTVVQIDQEAFRVKSGTSTTVTTYNRGDRGTTAAVHSNGATILLRPNFLDKQIIDALNAGIDACFPYIYKEVLDSSLTVLTNTYEYTVPYLPSTTVYIPRIWKVEMLVPGDLSYRRIEDWTIAKGATPKLKFREAPIPGSTLRIRGYGPFPHLALVSDALDAQWPASAEQLPTLFATSTLLASGEAGRVRNTAGAIDDREQANRTGSSSAAGRDLFQRFKDGLLNGGHMAPMQAHLVVTY